MTESINLSARLSHWHSDLTESQSPQQTAAVGSVAECLLLESWMLTAATCELRWPDSATADARRPETSKICGAHASLICGVICHRDPRLVVRETTAIPPINSIVRHAPPKPRDLGALCFAYIYIPGRRSTGVGLLGLRFLLDFDRFFPPNLFCRWALSRDPFVNVCSTIIVYSCKLLCSTESSLTTILWYPAGWTSRHKTKALD